ncbi:MAG: hypothetical protein AXW12_00620 [Thalassospira sp. Nap_22]|nr:MAG: hypothetical protein AXW12_00620 [Thalassospira sp. Nap_22]
MSEATAQQRDFVFAQRNRFKHPLFKAEKFCRGYAWDWIVANAVWREDGHPVEIKGQIVRLDRGQLSYSVRFMAEAWRWDKAAVSRFITRLKTEAMIETHTETGQMIITVCNYDKYQSRSGITETTPETGSETAARQHRDSSETKKNKDNKDNKDSDDDSRADQKSKNLFEEVTELLRIDTARNQNWFLRADIITELEQTHGRDIVLEAAGQVARSGKKISTPAYLRRVCETITEARQPVPSGTGSPASGPTDETPDDTLARLRAKGLLDDDQPSDEPKQEACNG